MPGYSLKKYPYLLMRDDYSIKIFNVVTKRMIRIKDATYASNAGYRTLDILSCGNQ